MSLQQYKANSLLVVIISPPEYPRTHSSVYLDRVAGLLHHTLQHHHDLVPEDHHHHHRYHRSHDAAPLLEEVLGAHLVEGAVLVDLVYEGGRPDEEQLVLLTLAVRPDLEAAVTFILFNVLMWSKNIWLSKAIIVRRARKVKYVLHAY